MNVPTPVIELHGVHKSFGDGPTRVHALRGVDFTVPRGELCSIMGPSGAGKSTVLHLAAGLTMADSGRVRVAGKDLSKLSDQDLTMMRRHDVGIVFQFFNLLPYLTAAENVALPLRLDGVTADEEEQRVSEALELVGIPHRRDHKPSELSGGEMQRVAIARALVIRPNILLADEPTGNLDTVAGRQIIDLLRDINESVRVTTLVVTHDPVWGASCDRVVRLVDGKLSEDIDLKPDEDESDEVLTIFDRELG